MDSYPTLKYVKRKGKKKKIIVLLMNGWKKGNPNKGKKEKEKKRYWCEVGTLMRWFDSGRVIREKEWVYIIMFIEFRVWENERVEKAKKKNKTKKGKRKNRAIYRVSSDTLPQFYYNFCIGKWNKWCLNIELYIKLRDLVEWVL